MRWARRCEFVEGEGPRLEPIRSEARSCPLERKRDSAKFARVCETVARLRQDLPRETALIGFCGAPWTVATYMVEGQGTPIRRTRGCGPIAIPTGFQRLIDLLADVSIEYLSGQVEAGADVVQIFDSWAGSLRRRSVPTLGGRADRADRRCG